MGKQSLGSKIREWLSGVAFRIFLYLIQMTEDEYFDEITRAAEHSNGADTGDTQAACEHHWVASANPGILCKCDKCGSETPLS